MEIDRLLKKRQLNVQEQNAVTAHRLTETARFWRDTNIPEALTRFGERQGIDWSKTVVLDLEVDFPGMPRLYGLILDQTERFIAFQIDTDSDHQHVEFVSQWENVSAHQNHTVSQRGTGKGFAVIALQVRREVLAQR
ncbi:hypothetical protein [Pseudomonas fluorescens]|uniref:Uncharacterized protein n=1 Tax=Pseudomonas fluorescens TaxID=294 RepID=A0A5E6XRI5_PSEFL|nr:hypothetical protein [Pseudomonas fluorescens]VVN42491.1 hypothetical protein PS655_05532 [Pseudomonas fluorescens]